MRRWELEEKEYGSLPLVYIKIHNIESGQSKIIIKKLSWPHIKSLKERVWQKFYSSIIEPVFGTFYLERDLQGIIIELSDNGSRARYIMSSIIRLKSVNGQEFLYSIGRIDGFNSLWVLSFDYVFNTQYILESVKAEIRARSEEITGEKVQSNPKIHEDNSIAAKNNDYYSTYK